MEHKIYAVVFLIFFLVNTSTSARKLTAKEEGDVKTSNKPVAVAIEITDDFSEAMGVKECEEDEECLKRRSVAEAHLDYIYTQQHKP